MYKTLIASAVFATIMTGPALTDERVIKNNDNKLLRHWSATGQWGVALGQQTKDNRDLFCSIVLLIDNSKPQDNYTIAFSSSAGSYRMVVSDTNLSALIGGPVSIWIDGIETSQLIGVLVPYISGYSQLRVPMDARTFNRALALFKISGSIKVVTPNADYSISLRGTPEALANFETCLKQKALMQPDAPN